jgi:hypothetical protein
MYFVNPSCNPLCDYPLIKYRNINKDNFQLHREVTEVHRVKKSDLCGSLWILCVSLCKFLN